MRSNPNHVPRNFRPWFLIAAVALLSLGSIGCKGKKKVVEAPAYESPSPEELKIAEAKSALQALLNSPPSRNWAELEEKERKLQQIRDMGLTDGEVYALIKQVESKLERERASLQEEEERRRQEEMYSTLNSTFGQIANAGNANIANSKIADLLSMFSSDSAPVLIIINKSGGIKDYDRPTNIRNYLNYLKDQGQNKNRVENIVFDSNGKIKELELLKQY